MKKKLIPMLLAGISAISDNCGGMQNVFGQSQTYKEMPTYEEILKAADTSSPAGRQAFVTAVYEKTDDDEKCNMLDNHTILLPKSEISALEEIKKKLEEMNTLDADDPIVHKDNYKKVLGNIADISGNAIEDVVDEEEEEEEEDEEGEEGEDDRSFKSNRNLDSRKNEVHNQKTDYSGFKLNLNAREFKPNVYLQDLSSFMMPLYGLTFGSLNKQTNFGKKPEVEGDNINSESNSNKSCIEAEESNNVIAEEVPGDSFDNADLKSLGHLFYDISVKSLDSSFDDMSVVTPVLVRPAHDPTPKRVVTIPAAWLFPEDVSLVCGEQLEKEKRDRVLGVRVEFASDILIRVLDEKNKNTDEEDIKDLVKHKERLTNILGPINGKNNTETVQKFDDMLTNVYPEGKSETVAFFKILLTAQDFQDELANGGSEAKLEHMVDFFETPFGHACYALAFLLRKHLVVVNVNDPSDRAVGSPEVADTNVWFEDSNSDCDEEDTIYQNLPCNIGDKIYLLYDNGKYYIGKENLSNEKE